MRPTHWLPLLALLLSCHLAAANLAPNPSFEEGVNGVAAAWNVPADGRAGEGGVVAYWTAEEAHSGERSLKLEMTGEGEGYILIGSPQLPILPGFEYEVSFWYRALGLRPETADRRHYAALILDNFLHTAPPITRVGNQRIILFQESPDWQRASQRFRITATEAALLQMRFQLVPKMPGVKPVAYVDDVELWPLDAALSNSGFEAGDQAPDGWRATSAELCSWTDRHARSGARSVSVTRPPAGQPHGWSQLLPCRADRKYGLAGWIRTERVTPHGTPPGAFLSLTFLDAQGATVGEPARSPALAGDNDWTEVRVEPVATPPGAVFLRVAAEMVFCEGTAGFDDLELSLAPTEAAVVRRTPREVRGPQPGVTYATNLVPNPTLEEGAEGQPAGWTFVGRADPDWTEEELDRFYTAGYPEASLGRGRGEWSEEAFAGSRSLLQIPTTPPLSPRFQWYGAREVDAYWLSDPMPCTPGQQYFAAAWIKIAARDLHLAAWHGPLRLFFYDQNGRRISSALPRPAFEPWTPGRWAWGCTAPITAPEGAATMRLVFNNVLMADRGDYGRMWGDNFAVWEMPAEGRDLPVPPPFQDKKYQRYFSQAHRETRPPYLPAPDHVPAADTVWAEVDAPAVGNLFFDPQAETPVEVQVRNLFAESRSLSLSFTRYDWQGNRETLPPAEVSVDAWGQSTARLTLPAPERFDTFYLEVTVQENEAPTASGAGRYAVLPEPTRPRYPAAESPWGVMPLVQVRGDGSDFERELGEMMKLAGYGGVVQRWQRWGRGTLEEVQAEYERTRPMLEYWKSLDIEVAGCIGYPGREAAAHIARLFGEHIAVWSVGGVEMANPGSPFRAVSGMSNEEYDRLVAETVEGIRSVLPDATIFCGAIATDMEAKVLQRWFDGIVGTRFDGYMFNTYMGPHLVLQNNFALMDAHGQTEAPAWLQEIPAHNAPIGGPGRRYGEKAAAANMVRTYVDLRARFWPRFQRIHTWGFVLDRDSEYAMVTSDLAPRPQYHALVVLTDRMGRASFDRSLGTDRVTIYRWREGDRTLGVLWATVGEQSVTLETGMRSVQVTDLRGNSRQVQTRGGLVTLTVTEEPLYLENAGDFTLSDRLQVSLSHGRSSAGAPPALQLALRNNSPAPLAGRVNLSGPIPLDPAEAPFELQPGGELSLPVRLAGDPPLSRRETFRAVAATEEGFVFAAMANLNFARAARVAQPPALDGTWRGWEAALPLRLAEREQVRQSALPGESWTGPADASATLKLLWDDQHLYLGADVVDDVFRPQPESGFIGFTGDSIEFALQPDNLLTGDAPRHEFELYLPGGEEPARLNWRFPNRQVTDWSFVVKPTGERGNVVYQVALPWSELGVKPEPGRAVSFALVLNDIDGDRFTGGRGWLAWFGGIAIGKDPSQYGDLILAD